MSLTLRWKQFINNDASSGIILVLSALLALVLANTSMISAYYYFLEIPVAIKIGNFEIAKPLVLWINDGLMALFFFVVGLEIKREIFYGQLSDKEQIVLPFVAAIAGIVFPALIYTALNYDDPIAINGWAIPSATDIAFALGIFILFGKHLPASLKLFLLSVAIIDDIGAVIIIALFYSQDLSTLSLIVAAVGLVVMFILNRSKVTSQIPYIIVAFIVWAAVLKSGVHATLAGFAVAWFIPMRKDESQSMSHHMEHKLHPWIGFFVLPLFAFANAGVTLVSTGDTKLITPISLGIIGGLFIGKQIGIFSACWLAVKLKLCQLPQSVTWTQLYGVSLLCGIGFTMSLFIGSLAFEDQGLAYQTQVKIGVLIGSLLSAVVGTLLIRQTGKKSVTSNSNGQSNNHASKTQTLQNQN
ncbi:Na+/H+ antiporter NhaA [Aliikangiella maris]|uniref:Na(+)/H(+) antiporter NhaA n=1 Tax=Aliikangiella maris TaxID=3162458 RepID=A0ABV3MPF8_9GAMM